MLMLLIAQAALAPRVTAPPPVVATMVPQVMMAIPGAGPRTRIGVIVRAPGKTLWDGSLWVAARGQSSSWRQSVQEALSDECVTSRSYDQSQDELNVTLSTSPYPSGQGVAARTSVSVRWTRPAEGGCGGSRIVELRQTVTLDGGKPQTIRGDGGLVIELRRM